MKCKKGMVLGEMIRLLIAAAILVVFAVIIARVLTQPESETVNSFKTLASEIKILAKDLDTTDKAQVTVPVFVEKTYVIGSVNPDSADSPEKCKKKSCLILYEKGEFRATNMIELEGAYIQRKDDEYIMAPDDTIIKVSVIAEKSGDKKIITLQKIS
jgi:hypothetical protein